MDPDFQMLSLRLADDISRTFSNISKKGIIGRFLHAMLYPEEEKMDISKFLTLFSKEVIQAKLLYMLFQEKNNLKQEKE